MKSRVTTLGGWLAGLGTIAAGVLTQMGQAKWAPLALGISAFGQILTGSAARDHNVTSEQAGLIPTPTQPK